jgi:hypothetical protein
MRNIFRFLKRLLKRIESWLLRFGEELKYRMKAARMLRKSPQKALTASEKSAIRKFYRKYGVWFPGTAWHRLYSGLSGSFSPEFVPNNLFYGSIERALNREDYAVLQDKNLLDRIFHDIERPKIVISNMNGFFFHGDALVSKSQALEILGSYDKLFIKPSLDSGGGKNVRVLEQKTLANKNDLMQILDSYQKDFLIQEALRQSSEMAELNPSSINTMRLITYLRPEGPVILASTVRMGAEGSQIDNTEAGGISAKIYPNGEVDKRAINKMNSFIEKKINGKSLDAFRIPNFLKVCDTALNLHTQIPFFKIVSWDLALNEENNPILIEFNVIDQGINQQSLIGPLFGKYADEIMEDYERNLVR